MKHEISAGGIVFKKAKGKKPKAESKDKKKAGKDEPVEGEVVDSDDKK